LQQGQYQQAAAPFQLLVGSPLILGDGTIAPLRIPAPASISFQT
jgi:hypothetical protein